MSRPARSAGLWVTFLVVVFLLFAGGAALTYMAITRPAFELVPEIAAEGGEMAGVRVNYPQRMPIWVLIRANIDPGLVRPEDLGPAQVTVLRNGEAWWSQSCSRSWWPRTMSIYLCSITIPTSELGEGTHRVSVVVESVTVGGKPFPIGKEAVKLTVVNHGGFWYYREIQLQPVTLTRSQLGVV